MEFSKLKKKLRIFANLKFAIFVLLAIALCGAIGSMIEQDQTATFYSDIYPKGKLFFGFLNCDTILNCFYCLDFPNLLPNFQI